MAKVSKLYVAYKAGYLGDNILDTYFAFVANMISENHLTVVEDFEIAGKFKEKYAIELPLPFVRQILGVGVQNKSFVEDHGKYSVAVEELQKYSFIDTDFNRLWDNLIETFKAYCAEKEIDISSPHTNEFVLRILDDSDDKILGGDLIEDQQGLSPIEYAWYSFVKEQGEKQTDLYSFIAALSASNITKQALFYTGEGLPDYSDLHVYLDSPIVFALLGMDEEHRTKSYQTLVADMIKAKCCVHVLDHNFQEVDSIIARAATWATNAQYDISKANNAARFFHDSQMSETEITEFCESIETKLNELGITVRKTSYDIYQDKFQEDEKSLFDMIKARYKQNGYELRDDKEKSIRIDVRSIVIIYRERQGQTATRLQNAKHILLTSNNAVANASKQYESNQSIESGHIPACVSADLFGTILWLNSPLQMLEYQKQKLLADCYAFLKPSRTLVNKYLQSLDEARALDEIDEKKYLFLRTHKVVLDALMNITHGDYARFSAKTYLEVYDDIQEQSQKLYRDEVAEHNITREKLKELEESSAEEKSKSLQEQEELKKRIAFLEKQDKERQEKEIDQKVKRWGWIATIGLAGIPYIILSVVIELCKTRFSSISWKSAFVYAGAAIATVAAGVLFAKGKKWCFKKVRTHVEKSSGISP